MLTDADMEAMKEEDERKPKRKDVGNVDSLFGSSSVLQDPVFHIRVSALQDTVSIAVLLVRCLLGCLFMGIS